MLVCHYLLPHYQFATKVKNRINNKKHEREWEEKVIAI